MVYVRKWIKNARNIALGQSIMPAILAVVLAIGQEGFNLWLGVAAVIGVCAAHLGMNLADDCFDYRVDMLSDREKVVRQGFRAMMKKYTYLTDGSETPRSLVIAIAMFLGVALICAVPIFILSTHSNGFLAPQGSWWILAIVVLGGILGMFYSAPPLKLCYRGLGELVIGVIFGPLLMVGTYYAAAGCVDSAIFWVSIPVGLLVLNILFTHSFIDMESDKASNKMTFARLLGSYKACFIASCLFTLVPFGMVVVAVIFGLLSPLYLLSLLVLPRAVWLCGSLKAFANGKQSVPDLPPRYLGRMGNWDEIRAQGNDWFLMRWLASRNTLTGFCFLLAAVKITLLIID